MKQWGVSGTLEYHLGDARLTSITGYRKSHSRPFGSNDAVNLDVYHGGTTDSSAATSETSASSVKITTLSQEIRFDGSMWDEKLDYLFGLYYSDEKINEMASFRLGADHQAYISAVLSSLGAPGSNSARNIFAGGVSSEGNFALNNYRQSNRNWSLFTNNTFHISDRFGVNLGLRYSNDRKNGSFDQIAAWSPACTAVQDRAGQLGTLDRLVPVAVALTCFPFATAVNTGPNTPVEFRSKYTDEQLVYTAKLLWEPLQDVNTYVSFSRGYKAGGMNMDSTSAVRGQDPRFKAEKVKAYELGVKASTFDNKATFNFALFYQDFADFQLAEFTGVQLITSNVDKARAKGFELESTLRPVRNLTISSSITYSKAYFPNNCADVTDSNQVRLLCGNDMTNAPRWTVVTGVDWHRDIGDTLEIGLNGSARLESDRRTTSQALTFVAAGTGNLSVVGGTNNAVLLPDDVQDGTVKVGLRASIGSQDGLWALEFWGNNITNEHTRGATVNVPFRGSAALPGPLNAGDKSIARMGYPQEPRTYGVTVRTKF